MRFLGAGAGGVRGEAVVEMADDKKRVREADADGSEGMNVVVLTGDDNEEVAVAGVALVSVSDEKTHEGDRDKVETKRARLQEAILVVQCSEEAVTALETEVVEDKTLTTRGVLIDDHHPCFATGPAAEDGEEAVQIVLPSQELSENGRQSERFTESLSIEDSDLHFRNFSATADVCRNSLSIEVADVEFLCSMHLQAGEGHFLC